MNLKNWIPLVAAVLLGLIALVVARKALNKSGSASAEPVVGVAVAARDLPPGRELAADDLTIARLPADAMPGGSFRTPQELVGRTTLQPLVKGQAVLDPLLAPTGTKGGLTGLIPTGQRAMTVEVNEFSGLAGMIQPGAHVDVIASLRDDKTDQQAARTILQNIEVRAVGRNINPAPPMEGAPPPPPSNNVTLLVTPRQAQILQLAVQNGRPWLVLRSNLDKEEPEAELTTLAALRNQTDHGDLVSTTQPLAPVPTADVFALPTPPRAAPRIVQVIRGGVESTVTFEQAARNPSHVSAPATRPTQMVPANDGRAITGLDQGDMD